MKRETVNKNVASIVTDFKMDENGQINYDIKISGNISQVIELGQKVFLECRTRLFEYREAIDAKISNNFKSDNK